MAGAPVGALRVSLGLNSAQFEQGMRRAQATARRSGQDIERSYVRMTQSGVRAFSTLRTGLAGFAGAVAGSAFVNYARDTLRWAAGLSETAQQIGVTVEQLQSLRLAATQNGASVEGMERAMGILNRTLGNAQGGMRSAEQAFRNVGITPEQLRTFRSGGEALQAIITGLSNIRNPAQQAAAAQALFGRGARELMVMLTQGAGAMSRWTDEARRAGIITDEQARKADEAEDALGRPATTIRANLAGAMADAMPGIIAIIDALGRLAVIAVRVIGFLGQITGGGMSVVSSQGGVGTASAGTRLVGRQQALQRWNELGAPRRGTPEYQRAIRDPQFQRLAPFLTGRPNPTTPQVTTGTADIDTSSRGGVGVGRRTDQAAQRRHQAAQELLDADIAILRAQEESLANIDEINVVRGQIAQIENQKWEAEVRFRRTQNEISENHVAELYARKRVLIAAEADARAREYNARVAEQENERADRQEGYAADRLRAEADLARTMEERRRIELELLRIATENRRRALVLQIDRARANRDDHAAGMAQLELDNLPAERARSERNIMRDTRGPLENFLSTIPQTAAQVRESLQSIAVDGLQSISDGLVDVITGARRMGDVFKNVVRSIISDLIRIQIQKAIIGPLTSALGGLFGGGAGGLTNAGATSFLSGARAAGGPVLPGRTYLIGEKGPELLRMGASGGQVIANDNIGGGGDVHVHQTFEFRGVAITQDEFMQGLMATKDATMRAVHQVRRRQG